MSWPRVDRIRCFRPLYTRYEVSRLIGEFLPEMLCDLCSSSNPYSFLLVDVFNDLLQSSEASRLADASAVESNGHHLGRTFTAFIVEYVECVRDVVVEFSWSSEAGCDVEFVVIAIWRCENAAMKKWTESRITVRIWDHEHALRVFFFLLSRNIDPIRHIIGVRVRLPQQWDPHLLINIPY